MQICPIKTHKIAISEQSLLALLDAYVLALAERSILAITSKIVAICEGRMVKLDAVEKQTLIVQEADYFLPAALSKYNTPLTIKQNILIPAAGIDESNSDGHYILWPYDPQQSANRVRVHLQQRFHLQQVGVMITDSNVTPLRMGVTGVALAHSGFQALNDYVGKADLFGRPLRFTRVNVVDALATAAVLVMGEGSEQTPLALIEDLPFVTFQDRDPTPAEVQQLRIPLEDDLYGPLLTLAPWQNHYPL